MKLKSLYLVLFMLCMSTAIFAQEKYEQAIVNQFNPSHTIYISMDGQEFKKIKVDAVAERFFDYTPLLKQIEILRNDGWEVWNTSTYALGSGAEHGVIYFLRRKLK